MLAGMIQPNQVPGFHGPPKTPHSQVNRLDPNRRVNLLELFPAHHQQELFSHWALASRSWSSLPVFPRFLLLLHLLGLHLVGQAATSQPLTPLASSAAAFHRRTPTLNHRLHRSQFSIPLRHHTRQLQRHNHTPQRRKDPRQVSGSLKGEVDPRVQTSRTAPTHHASRSTDDECYFLLTHKHAERRRKKRTGSCSRTPLSRQSYAPYSFCSSSSASIPNIRSAQVIPLQRNVARPAIHIPVVERITLLIHQPLLTLRKDASTSRVRAHWRAA